MITGVQFRGTLVTEPDAALVHVQLVRPPACSVGGCPDTAKPGAAEVDWDVAIERADAAHVTYWITVTNLTSSSVQFEARYAIVA